MAKFQGKKKKNSDWVRVTTLFKKDPNDIPDFLKAKWTVVLDAGDEYFEALKEKVNKAAEYGEDGRLMLDVSRSKDDEDGNLVLNVTAFESDGRGSKGRGKKSRDDDDGKQTDKGKTRRRTNEDDD